MNLAIFFKLQAKQDGLLSLNQPQQVFLNRLYMSDLITVITLKKKIQWKKLETFVGLHSIMERETKLTFQDTDF